MRRIITILFVVLAFAAVGLGYLMFADRSSFRAGLSSYVGLPSTASDISVYQNPNISGLFAADFSISEPDWGSFCAERRWGLGPARGDEQIVLAAALRDGRPNDRKAITNGLYFSQRSPNGAGVTVAYDRAASRAYIVRSSR